MTMRFAENRDFVKSQARAGMTLLLLLTSLGMSGFAQDIPSQRSTLPGKTAVASEFPGPAALPYADSLSSKALQAPHAYISGVSTSKEGGNLVIAVSTSGPVTHQEFMLENPPRLVIDFLNVENRIPVLNLPVEDAAVKQVRVRQFQNSEPKIARMVIDLEAGHGEHRVVHGTDKFSLVFNSSHTSHPAESSRSLSTAGAPSQAPRTIPAAAQIPSRATVPVISDLSAAEIPQSALKGAKTAEAAPVKSAPAPRPGSPVVSLPPAAAELPSPSLIAMKGSASSQYGGHPLTLDLVNISLVDFFRLMAEEGGVNIVMDPEIKGTLSIKVVKVPWDQIFEAALTNNGLDKKVEGNLIRIAQKATLQKEAKQSEDLKKANLLAADVDTRVKRLNYAKAAEVISPLKDQMTVRGTLVVDERTNSLVITDIPATVDKILALVETLDIPQPQVEIEARIVSATRDFARDLGIQFGFVQGNLDRVTVGGPNTFGTIGGSRPSATPKNTYATGNPLTGRGASESSSTESASISTGTSENDRGNFNVNLPASKAFGGVGLSIGNIFDTFLLDTAITAGESKGLAKLISQPKVTAQNNSEATITQGLRFPVQIIANNTVTIQFQNAALTLRVVPQITYEGNIVLDLRVENNTPDFSRSVNGIPSIRTSESATRVLVTDGGTTVIGGILIESEQSQEDRVPGLASLPIVGNLFKRSSVYNTTQEVLFFITPRIVK